MRARRLFLPALLGSLLFGATPLARAQSPENAAAAEALFREGKALIKDGEIEKGCAKLEASQRLDAAAGTLINLADCHEKLGRTASAWAEFSTVAGNAKRKGDAEREAVARGRAEALEPKLLRIVVNVPQESRVPGLEVRRDGVLLDPAIWGSATPVDPGAHEILATAPGKRELRQTVDARGEGKTFTIDLGKLADAPTGTTTVPAGSAAGPQGTRNPGTALPKNDLPKESPGSARSTVGWITGGAGVAGLIAGSVLGLLAKSKWDSAACVNKLCPTQPQQDDAVAAKGLANGATIAFVAGGALTAAGLVLVLTAPSTGEPKKAARVFQVAPQVGMGSAGLLLDARF